jgi:FKBP-type peptidyl-prolyl cis-trans isomerase SlyD
MQIAANTVCRFHYTLKNGGGETLDSSAGSAPLTYLHGFGGIIPGLERQMLGKTVGDKFTAHVPAAEAYGLADPSMIQPVPKSQLGAIANLHVGMQLQAYTGQGEVVVRVAEIREHEVMIDANHPLAGQDLFFEVEVVDIRAATQEEIAHRHVHGEGGHHHH